MDDSNSAESRFSARVVITGAAHGVGRACAIAFAALGAELILCDHDAWALQHVARTTGALARFCDIASEASVEQFAADILASFDRIDVLINSAGRDYVRALGMMWVSRALLPALCAGADGKLIANVAPPPGLAGERRLFANAGSEAAFARLSESIALRTRLSAVRTATIVVGASAQSFVRQASCEDGPAAILVPLDRADPMHVAAAIADLACATVPALKGNRPRERRRRRA